MKAKHDKNHGLSGVSKKGKAIKKRVMGAACFCRSKCQMKVSEESRKNIFVKFWMIGDHVRRWDHISRMIDTHEPKERTIEIDSTIQPRKMRSTDYYLKTSSGKVKVCGKMFRSTYGKKNSAHNYNYKINNSVATQQNYIHIIFLTFIKNY